MEIKGIGSLLARHFQTGCTLLKPNQQLKASGGPNQNLKTHLYQPRNYCSLWNRKLGQRTLAIELMLIWIPKIRKAQLESITNDSCVSNPEQCSFRDLKYVKVAYIPDVVVGIFDASDSDQCFVLERTFRNVDSCRMQQVTNPCHSLMKY